MAQASSCWRICVASARYCWVKLMVRSFESATVRPGTGVSLPGQQKIRSRKNAALPRTPPAYPAPAALHRVSPDRKIVPLARLPRPYGGRPLIHSQYGTSVELGGAYRTREYG